MIFHCLLPNRRIAMSALVCLCLGATGKAEVVDLRPIADTFVVHPGSDPPHAKMLGLENCDFGGAGSLSLASATAHDETAVSPNNKPHGYFRALMRFDGTEVAGTTVQSATLSLFTTRWMNGGKDIFNPRAMSGYFTISLLTLPTDLEWVQGYGSPETLTSYVYDPAEGLTHNLLESLLGDPAASLVDVATVYFDAGLLDPNAVQTWMTYEIDSPVLNEALSAGGVFSLLLSAADESVNFNFSGRVQNNTPFEPPVLWENGPILRVTAVPEPGSLTLLAIAGGLCGGLYWRRRVPLRVTERG